MSKIEINNFADFEVVVKRVLAENAITNDEAKDPIYTLLLQVFRVGFEAGKNGKSNLYA